MTPTYQLFVSHGWSYEDSYYRILDYLDVIRNNYEDFDYLNSAEPEPDVPDLSYTEELKVEYTEQVSNADAVILLADLYRSPESGESNYIFWLDYALEQAREQNKPVIGVRPWNQKKTPQEIQNAPDKWVDWDPEVLKKSIENSL